MCGFIIGIACLIALKKVVGGRRGCHGCHGGRHGCHGGRHGWHGHRRWRRGRQGPGRWWRGKFWDLLDHLDTSPGQEKVIRAEVAKLWEMAHGTRRAWRRSGNDIARAMRGESFDKDALGAAFTAQQSGLDEMRQAVEAAMERIHEVLDPEQRERLAEIFESGDSGGEPFGGPYRS